MIQISLKEEDGVTHQNGSYSQGFELQLGQCLRVYRHDAILTEVAAEQKEVL